MQGEKIQILERNDVLISSCDFDSLERQVLKMQLLKDKPAIFGLDIPELLVNLTYLLFYLQERANIRVRKIWMKGWFFVHRPIVALWFLLSMRDGYRILNSDDRGG